MIGKFFLSKFNFGLEFFYQFYFQECKIPPKSFVFDILLIIVRPFIFLITKFEVCHVFNLYLKQSHTLKIPNYILFLEQLSAENCAVHSPRLSPDEKRIVSRFCDSKNSTLFMSEGISMSESFSIDWPSFMFPDLLFGNEALWVAFSQHNHE